MIHFRVKTQKQCDDLFIFFINIVQRYHCILPNTSKVYNKGKKKKKNLRYEKIKDQTRFTRRNISSKMICS